MQTALVSVLATLLVVGLGALLYLLGRNRGASSTSGGMTLGPYRRLVLLSDKGGMARIYSGHNSASNRPCVLKVLRQELLGDADVVRKFRREAEILEQLKKADPLCPVPTVYGTGSVSTGFAELPFIEMERIPGHTHLGDWLREKGKLTIAECEIVVAQIGRALRVAHRLGVVHRDLKPGNLLLADGRLDRLVVIDFGVAKKIDARSVTVGGYGTAAYMSPEQCGAGEAITAATDVYALGALWYEMATGRRVYEDENPLLVMQQHREGLAGERVRAHAPAELRARLAAMLERDPSRRPSVEDVLRGLGPEASRVEGYRTGVPAAGAPARRARRGWRIAALAAGAAALAVALVWIAIPQLAEKKEREERIAVIQPRESATRETPKPLSPPRETPAPRQERSTPPPAPQTVVTPPPSTPPPVDPPPSCRLSASSLDFGALEVGSQAEKRFTIQNAGGGRLTGSVSVPAGTDFKITAGGGAYDLAAGAVHSVAVRFSPSGPGAKSVTISTGASCSNVTCAGSGKEPAPPPPPPPPPPQPAVVTAPRDMVLVRAGTFTMGSPSGELGRDSNEDQHQVTLTRSFYVSKYEVTQSEWESVMGWNESGFRGSSRPVENVTWFDAVMYCNKRSEREGLTPAYTILQPAYSGNHITSATVMWNKDAYGYRLLTEAEWEHACRAGSGSAFCNGTITSATGFDSKLDLVGWYDQNSGSQTHAVGGKSPNAWGLYDMHGNVWEWCWDWYGSYGGTATDPTGPGSGSYRVLRGGSWFNCAQFCRSASRIVHAPGNRDYYLGFRLARNGS
ncbi:MAG: SUMF1/EgtB/PvdO family nonheme iron enzyme [Candidatus Eisenbacteria bacterium]|nr:SUMF1/EgtB/PvdO family nonheme iron enzyme [Candidatus Eisenbacteria bacterium]